ncbi:hypothetical protein MA16_Dca027154 [Dendrobium catenatum]|uniref:Uncharacterized protein n=1 Tax=Dendrobium catenatum TaxID=906689 RepID=A0A2I0VF10_9ASPA|nr:hypothetical protein MA16_Dca027154 [Dendrobium catenatum]
MRASAMCGLKERSDRLREFMRIAVGTIEEGSSYVTEEREAVRANCWVVFRKMRERYGEEFRDCREEPAWEVPNCRGDQVLGFFAILDFSRIRESDGEGVLFCANERQRVGVVPTAVRGEMGPFANCREEREIELGWFVRI